MLKISEILINKTKDLMEFHKRNASGKAVESLREIRSKYGVQIVGVDYFENIFNGIPSGTNVSLSDLNTWKQAKEGRYNISVPAGIGVQQNINAGKAWINDQTEKLNIDTKVLKSTKTSIDVEVKKLINQKVKQWQSV